MKEWSFFIASAITMMLGSIPQQDVFQRVMSSNSASTARTGPVIGATPIVFDGRLWLIGANRRGTFDPGTLVTDDLETWTSGSAPWPARGGAAVWVMNNQLFMTGGKYSEGTGANIRFIYRNDVWSMARKR